MNIEKKKMLNNKMGTKVDINTRLQQTMDILLKRFNGKKIDEFGISTLFYCGGNSYFGVPNSSTESNKSTTVMLLVGGQGHSYLGSAVNPIQTRGADYVHHIIACPPGFEILTASLQRIVQIQDANKHTRPINRTNWEIIFS